MDFTISSQILSSNFQKIFISRCPLPLLKMIQPEYLDVKELPTHFFVKWSISWFPLGTVRRKEGSFSLYFLRTLIVFWGIFCCSISYSWRMAQLNTLLYQYKKHNKEKWWIWADPLELWKENSEIFGLSLHFRKLWTRTMNYEIWNYELFLRYQMLHPCLLMIVTSYS